MSLVSLHFGKPLRLLLPLFVLFCSARALSNTPVLVAKNSVWKYNSSGLDQGSAWRAPGFDDSSWPSGSGILGFGETYIATTLSSGKMTYYFRQSFSLTDDPATFSSLTLLANYDDGFVAYLNGQEVARRSMPDGAIVYNTPAYSHEGGVYQAIDLTSHLNKLTLGANVLAIEVHQLNSTSSDLVMDMELNTLPNAGSPVTIARTPYLQMATPTSMVVRWRTNAAVNSRVRYGTDPGNLSSWADDAALTTEHVVALSNLTPNTMYYYSVGTTTTMLAGGPDYHFVTNPPNGATKNTRLWIIGDAGYGNAAQQRIRDSYLHYTGATNTDMFVLLGDNAYNNGTDAEYQAAVFDMHPATLRQSVLWPVFGNHDALSASSPTQSGVFYDIFTLPANGESGGVASGTEAYYAFNYGNIHFIVLNSQDIPRGPAEAMLTWLQQDLAANTLPWTIAFWHHPPYSKGSHNSDTEGFMIEMRQNALPILEAAGVDLVFSGHSHSYERSFLLDGHYGQSISLITDNILNGGSGRVDGDGAYTKRTYGSAAHQGAVYVVAGSGSITSGGALNHPAMYLSLNVLGSVVLDVNGNQADVKFLDDFGNVRDYFTLIKGVGSLNPPAAPENLAAASTGTSTIDLTWEDHSNNESGFKIERKTGALGVYEEIAVVDSNVTSYSDTALRAGTTYYYRVRAHNEDGDSGFSNEANATTSSPSSGPILIAKNSVWKYEASGVDLGTAWREMNFDDSSWPSGAGVLGFGENYIATTLPSGKMTYYFRHTFTLSEAPATLSALHLLANFDDGFVAYLNGQEVARRSLPGGAITYASAADLHEGGEYEAIALTAHLDKLVLGANVFALEIHQADLASSDVVMDLELNHEASELPASTLIAKNSFWKYEASGADLGTAWREASFNDNSWPSGAGVLGFGENYVTSTLPAGNVTYYFRHSFTLANNPANLSALNMLVNYDDGFVAYLNGEEVARRSLPGGPIAYYTTASSHEGGAYELIDLASHLDKLVLGANVLAVEAHQISASSSDMIMDIELNTEPSNTTPLILIAMNSAWKYEAGGTALGPGWQQASFDDGSWPSGNGVLGFGESFVTTTMPTGNMTYYFRHKFTLADDPASFSALTLLANYDDGFVVYLNGEEIARRFLPGGAISYATAADLHEGGAYESIDLTSHLDQLALGDNVLAVEVHQATATSSDLVLDLQLSAQQSSNAAANNLLREQLADADLTIVPRQIELHQNYPNPFNPSTLIRFDLPVDAQVSLKVYNLMGEKVETLLHGWRGAGRHTVKFEPKNLASGAYMYVLQAGPVQLKRKCLFAK